MIKCLAIDDEPLALKQLAAYLQKIPYLQLVECCRSSLEAARLMQTQQVDVLFIDINMPDLNGLDFVRSLRQPPMVVFTTAYHEYAVDAYKVNAIDYLLKPFGMADIMRAADKVKRQYELTRAAATPTADDSDALFVKADHKVVRVAIDQIVYVEGMSEYLRIYLERQGKPLVTLLTMKKMEERLETHNFLRIHKSYIINMRHFSEMNKSRVTLDNQVTVPLGDSYRDNLFNYLSGKLLGK